MDNKILNKLGFGTWGIGGDTGPLSGYGPTDDKVSTAAIRKALSLGISFFDTAPPYGNGKAEKLIGLAISEQRKNVKVLTKIGVQKWEDVPNYSPNFIKDSISISLSRLNTDYIDYAIFHSLKKINIEGVIDGYKVLQELKDKGVVKNIGFSLKSPGDLKVLSENISEIDVIEANFNLLDIRLLEEELLSIITKKEIFTVLRTPFAFGFLTKQINLKTKFHESDHRFRWPIEQRKSWEDGKAKLTQIFNNYDYNFDIELCALKFCLSFDEFNVVIPGMITPEEVMRNSEVHQLPPIPKECINEIVKLNLTRESFVKT